MFLGGVDGDVWYVYLWVVFVIKVYLEKLMCFMLSKVVCGVRLVMDMLRIMVFGDSFIVVCWW